jgi:hypothetical protein
MTILQEAREIIDAAKEAHHCKVPGCLEEAHEFGLLCQTHEAQAQDEITSTN